MYRASLQMTSLRPNVPLIKLQVRVTVTPRYVLPVLCLHVHSYKKMISSTFLVSDFLRSVTLLYQVESILKLNLISVLLSIEELLKS